jgi:hypothetical protein
MRKYYSLLLLFLIILFFACTDSKNEVTDVRKGKYFGLDKPGNSPMIFAPGLISTNLSERDITFTPDGKELYYTIWSGSFGVIVVIKEGEDGWSDPNVTSFSKEFSNLEPFVTVDGSKLFFASNRPLDTGREKKDYDIWYVERKDTGWGEPINSGYPINTESNEFYPSEAENGNLYYTAAYSNSIGGEDIWMCEYNDGKYMEPQNLGTSINSKTDEFNAFIAPDESYIIYSSWAREDGSGSGDLYISFRNDKNKWAPTKNLGDKINSPALDFCPYVTIDGKFFFFTSRKFSDELSNAKIKYYKSLISLLNNTQNGNNDIYWVSSNFIDSLKQTDN